jgi:hypothetical protein
VRIRLILPDPTGIGVGLSHASRAFSSCGERGARLSSTQLTYPKEGDNPGKLGLISHKPRRLEGAKVKKIISAC